MSQQVFVTAFSEVLEATTGRSIPPRCILLMEEEVLTEQPTVVRCAWSFVRNEKADVLAYYVEKSWLHNAGHGDGNGKAKRRVEVFSTTNSWMEFPVGHRLSTENAEERLQFRVRAKNKVGYGAWSKAKALTVRSKVMKQREVSRAQAVSNARQQVASKLAAAVADGVVKGKAGYPHPCWTTHEDSTQFPLFAASVLDLKRVLRF